MEETCQAQLTYKKRIVSRRVWEVYFSVANGDTSGLKPWRLNPQYFRDVGSLPTSEFSLVLVTVEYTKLPKFNQVACFETMSCTRWKNLEIPNRSNLHTLKLALSIPLVVLCTQTSTTWTLLCTRPMTFTKLGSALLLIKDISILHSHCFGLSNCIWSSVLAEFVKNQWKATWNLVMPQKMHVQFSCFHKCV